MKGHVAAIQLLLNYGSDIECRDRDGTTLTELPSHPSSPSVYTMYVAVKSDTFSW